MADVEAVPKTWGPGQLFAFSGMEGPTRATSPMVGHTLSDRIGLRIQSEPAVELWCQADRGDDPNRRYPRCQPFFEIVTGDAIRLSVKFTDGVQGRLAFAPIEQDVFAGYTIDRLPVRWSAGNAAGQPLPDGAHACEIDNGLIVLCIKRSDGMMRFAVGYDPASFDAARGKAESALKVDIDNLIDQRKAWVEAVDLPANLPDEFVGTYRKAVSIMRVNTCTPEGQIAHQWTTPDRWPHRWMWLHDTAYHAAGHVYHFPDLAADMLAAVFDTQDDDGRVALFMEPNQNFPNLSQSPILTWGVRQAYEATANRDFLSEIYPKVRAYLEYFIKTRAFDDTGLYRWLHSDESMDNNPRFDQTSDFAAVDLSCTLCREFEEAATLADALGLDEEVTYWRNRRSKTAEALNELLWDEKTGQYGDLMRDGKLVTLSTCVTFLPLFAGVVPTGRAEQLLKLLKDPSKFWVELPVPTVAADEACFYPDMWRGPAWINMNHLISEGLERSGFSEVANELRQRSLRTVNRWRRHTGCIYEFYDCEDVIPPFLIDRKSRICYGGGFTNISDYHWTSALFVAMCRRVYG